MGLINEAVIKSINYVIQNQSIVKIVFSINQLIGLINHIFDFLTALVNILLVPFYFILFIIRSIPTIVAITGNVLQFVSHTVQLIKQIWGEIQEIIIKKIQNLVIIFFCFYIERFNNNKHKVIRSQSSLIKGNQTKYVKYRNF